MKRCASSALKAPTVVAGLDYIAVVGEAIEQRGRHLGDTEDTWPLAKGKAHGRDD
jgi:hypothetical protein